MKDKQSLQTSVAASTRLTVSEALEQYRSRTEDAKVPLRASMDSLITSGVKTEFENDSYLDALYLTDLMFTRTEKSVCYLTGGSCEGFLEALKDPFEKMLLRLEKINGKVRIVVLNCATKSVLFEQLCAKFPLSLEVQYAKGPKTINHFIVCDSKIARVEEPHEELSLTSFADEIKAKVFFQNTDRSKRLEVFFNQIWAKLTKS